MAFALLTSVALAALPLAQAHVALWHPSMFGWVPNDIQQQEPVNPLYDLPFSQWWGHGYTNIPPAAGVFMNLPAGGTFHGEVACNRAWTSYGPQGSAQNITWACDGTGALHTTDTLGNENPTDVKGCGLAIAYESDITKVTPEEMVVFSTNYTCPWKRNVDFQIPADLPACPSGGCICSWNWVHSPDSGSEQIYNLLYRCQVTGATNTRALTKTPSVPNRCPVDRSNCTVGPKVPMYWLQAERNNFFQGYYDPPYYNGDYGFANGAQTDLFAVVASSSSKAASSTAASSSKPASASVSSSKPATASSSVKPFSSAIASSSVKPSSVAPATASASKSTLPASVLSSKPASASATSNKAVTSASVTSAKPSSASATSAKPSSASVTSSKPAPVSSTSIKPSSTMLTSTKPASVSSTSIKPSSTMSTSSKPATSSTPAPMATAAVTAVAGYTYVGCKMDNSTRALSGASFSNTSMTVAECARQCGNTAYTAYMGLENGNQCFCASRLTFDTTLAASACGAKCGGDATTMCGGSWAISLWKKTTTATSSSSKPASASSSGCGAAATRTVTVTVTAKAPAATKRAEGFWSRSRLIWASLADASAEGEDDKEFVYGDEE